MVSSDLSISMLNELCHAISYIKKKNDKTNDPVLLFKTIFKHLDCLVSSVFTDGKDGHGQVLMLCRQKLPK